MSNDALPRQQDPSQSYPKDREPAIFGGAILSHIDIAAAIEAHRHYPGRVVTIAMDQVVFKQPVTVKVLVWAQRFVSKQLCYVTEAVVTLVAVDDQGRKVAIGKPSRSGLAE